MALGPKGSPHGSSAGRSLPAILLLTALVAAGPARAQITTLEPPTATVVEEEEPFSFIVVGVTGFGGLGTYGMQQVNEALAVVNRDIEQPGVRFDPFSGGPSAGGGLRAIIKERILFQADLERLGTSQDIGGIVANSKISLPADGYLVTLGYDLLQKRTVGFGMEAGGGYYKAKGKQEITETNVSKVTRSLGTLNLDGHALGAHVGAYLEASLSQHIWVNFFAGYRRAKITDIDITGLETLRPAELSEASTIDVPVAVCPDCPDANNDGIPDSVPAGATPTLQAGGRTIDYSGFMGRMALTYYVNIPGD
ncbi:MAG: hypothetical protein U0167_16950 [bacterium]